MAFEYIHRRRVEFSETDMAGIMHFSNFFRLMESTEVAFYRSLQLPIVDPQSGIGWPRVHAECDYAAPLLFDEEVDIHLAVEEKRTRSIRFRHKFVKRHGDKTVVAARGVVVAVCVRRTPEGKLESIAIPPSFNAGIESAPAGYFDTW